MEEEEEEEEEKEVASNPSIAKSKIISEIIHEEESEYFESPMISKHPNNRQITSFSNQ